MTDQPRPRRDVVRDLIPPEVLADLDEDRARESRAAIDRRMPPHRRVARRAGAGRDPRRPSGGRMLGLRILSAPPPEMDYAVTEEDGVLVYRVQTRQGTVWDVDRLYRVMEWMLLVQSRGQRVVVEANLAAVAGAAYRRRISPAWFDLFPPLSRPATPQSGADPGLCRV